MKSGTVAIIGQPNVGKSSLLNRLVGESVAIVTPKPQTTRQNIVGILNRPGAQIVFTDTPGFHESKKTFNRMMVDKIGEALVSTDVVLLVVEPKKNPDELDLALFRMARAKSNAPLTPALSPKGRGSNLILIINKIDTVISEPWGVVVERYWEKFDQTPTVAVSAARGDGIETLLNKTIEFLPEGKPLYPDDEYTSHPVRFLAAELIREQAMKLLRQELPYSLAVEIDDFKEPKAGEATRIRATIVVEKDSQKGIVIGAGGQMIKKIGTLAREKIEALVQGKVFLELFVRVEEDWTRSAETARRFI